VVFTLTGPAHFEDEIRKSRFLALAAPASSVAQATGFVAANHAPDATHNCWAYKLGDTYRFNDDGEPGGTAGRPILQAIEGQQCDHVVVLVIRWFGGVKLGTGGLVRAYGGTAAQCLRLADKKQVVARVQLRCRCLFSDIARVQSKFPAYAVSVMREEFDAHGVDWLLCLPQSQAHEFGRFLSNASRGQSHWTLLPASPEDGDND
jgi:uncharacterized YigZ family protein